MKRGTSFRGADVEAALSGIDYLWPESARIEAVREVERILKPGGHFVFSPINNWARSRRPGDSCGGLTSNGAFTTLHAFPF